MSGRRRAVGYLLLGVLITILIILGLVFFFTKTRSGVNMLSRFAVERLERSVSGKLSVDSVTTRGLLGSAVLHNVLLTDLERRTFAHADSIRLSYNLRSFLAGNIIFSRATLYGPTVVIERLPGDSLWNFEHIFPPGPPKLDDDRNLVQFGRTRVVDGTFIVRYPIEPEPGETIEPSDTARMIVRQTATGPQRELRFEEINANLHRLIWETPDEEGRLVEIASLSTRGYLWTDPFVVRDLRGAVSIRDSVIAFDLPAFALPDSRGSAIGEIVTGKDRIHYDIRISADQLAFLDLEWLYPPLPDEGGGRGIIRIQTQPEGTLYLIEDARLQTSGTNIAGTFGIVLGDTLYFTQVDLKASPLDLRLLRQIVPDAPLLEGLLVGTVEVEGPISALTTRGEFSLASGQATTRRSRLSWTGTLDLERPFGVTALDAELNDVDLALLTPYFPDLAATGTISGRVQATGTFGRQLNVQTALGYHPPGLGASAVRGGGTITWTAGRPAVDLAFDADSLDLQGLAHLIPALERLEGKARGDVVARGDLDDLELTADLLADAGRLQLHGRLALAGEAPSYHAEGSLSELRLDRLFEGALPRDTDLAARFTVAGQGIAPGRARAEIGVHLDAARIAGIEISTGQLGLRIDEGLVHIDSLVVTTVLGALRAEGALGLGPDRDGTVRVLVVADSLSELRSIFFPDAPEVIVDPDSTRGRVAGSARIEAELRGTIAALDISGTAQIRQPSVDAAAARQISIDFGASGLGIDSQPNYRLVLEADSLEVYGQRLDQVAAVMEFGHGSGWFEIEGTGSVPHPSAYHLIGGFQPREGEIEFDLRELRARTGREEWGLAGPTRIRVGATGVEVDDLLFSRTTGAGRITATGRLPWVAGADDEVEFAGNEVADLRIEFQQLPIFTLRESNETAPLSVGDLTGKAVVSGTALAPRIDVDLDLSDTRFGQLEFEKIEARLDYADRHLGTRIEVIQDGRAVLAGAGSIPLDLRLTPVDDRRLDESLIFTARADGVPAAVLGSLVDGFRGIEGRIVGTLTLGGTTRAPEIGGQLTLENGAATWAVSGVRYHGVAGSARVINNQLVNVKLTARTTGGSATVGGTMNFQNLTDPTFDLKIVARNFQAVRRRDVELTASGEVQLRGSYTRPHIDGRISVDRGALYLDEVWRQYQIVALDDPLVFDLFDQSFAIEQLISDEVVSDFVKNMKVEAEIEIGRDSWLRGRNLNVEVSGLLLVEVDRSTEEIRLTGTLNAVRGTYELFVAENLPARRFLVRGGTVEFDGTPGINPAFDITAGYRVRTTDRQPLNVIAHVTGNLESPRVSLSNEGDETIGESDLLSYLVFGRPTHALAGGEARQLDTYLTGLGAGILTPTYLGVWAMGIETLASNLGIADYVSITPTEADTIGIGEGLRAFDPFSALGRAQFEIGNYVGDAWYLAVTRRFGQGVKPFDFGVRLEWRLAPTWTAEFFIEDRFGRLGPTGLDQPFESRKVGGFFLFREWGF